MVSSEMRLTLLLSFTLVTALYADFDAGLRAYRAQDYATALTEWQPLADQGAPEAQNNVGVMYALGQGVQKDATQAASWYQKAAEQGYEKAEFNLGLLYSKGDVAQRNPEQAEKWFKKAAESGDVNAVNALADLYANDGHNGAEAKNWYAKAADQSNPAAEFGLAMVFDLGKGMPADPAEADKWYRKAAEQGYVPALTNIGILYYDGTGVKRDLVLAYEYFLLGAKGGDTRAPGLVEWTGSKLTKKQIKRATDLAANWEAAHSMQTISSTQSAGLVATIQ